MNIPEIVERQKQYFATGATLPIEGRKKALLRLRDGIVRREAKIYEALYADLGKSACEAFMSEIGMVLEEISFLLKNLKKFTAPHKVKPSISQFPAKCYTLASPYGAALIMSPWNYPFQLTLCPLADCIAAGNCALVKSSAYAPATANLIKEIVEEQFEPQYIAVVTGGRAENEAVLQQQYDMIFFTGSVPTGRVVARAAAETLTPTVLELGGKSPCIVDEDADIARAARRIAFGKLLNAGQTCVAPDYLLVHEKVKPALLEALEGEFVKMCGENALENKNYPHIVNEKHFLRVKGLISPEKVVFGGDFDEKTLKIQPTILDGATADDPAMQEEIFGPVLPVLTFRTFDEAKRFIAARPSPLALYYFGKKNEQSAVRDIRFGGGCINDTVMHLATSHMGFGGVGESGMGAYHGQRGFEAFSHIKSIQKKGTMELSLRYAPYSDKKLKSLKQYIH